MHSYRRVTLLAHAEVRSCLKILENPRFAPTVTYYKTHVVKASGKQHVLFRTACVVPYHLHTLITAENLEHILTHLCTTHARSYILALCVISPLLWKGR